MGRDVGLDSLKGKKIPGVYLINVPKAVRSYYKIGVSYEDIEKRLSQYILSYPFGFHIVAVMLFPKTDDGRARSERAERKVINYFAGSPPDIPDRRVFKYKGMHTSEWIKLSNKKEIKEMKDLLTAIAKYEGGSLSWFSTSHSINLPI